MLPVGIVPALLLLVAELPLGTLMDRRQRQLVPMWICEARNGVGAAMRSGCGADALNRLHVSRIGQSAVQCVGSPLAAEASDLMLLEPATSLGWRERSRGVLQLWAEVV